MTDKNVEVKFYLDKVLALVDGANPEACKAIAFQVESQTKLNIRANDQIDTGFMANSVYTITKDDSGYATAKADAENCTINRNGDTVDHTGDMAPETSMDTDALAGVSVGANYAIYQEVMNPFFYPAAESVSNQAGATVKKVFDEMVSDGNGGYIASGRQVTK